MTTIVALTRSTGTLHTSAKARLTGVAIRIRIRIRDPDRHQNVIVCSLAHIPTFSEIFVQLQIRLEVFAQSC